LSQIISNLLSNAIKFTKEGSVKLDVHVLNVINNVATLEFKIQDTGIGIPEEKQELIFNKYNQITNSNNYLLTQSGTGLGLSIAKQLTKLMKGEIGLHSKENEGSSFWVNIEMPILNPKNTMPADVSIKNTNQYNFNVLLVDDRDVNLKVASLMLKKLGCEVETAQNGEVAIAKYDQNPTKFDLIIMDIQMPVMDGINATKTLRKKYQENLAPIYGLSAQIPKNLQKTPKELGFDFYLTKPLSLETLKQSLNKIV
jgi:CheY-like chemotaxis protein